MSMTSVEMTLVFGSFWTIFMIVSLILNCRYKAGFTKAWKENTWTKKLLYILTPIPIGLAVAYLIVGNQLFERIGPAFYVAAGMIFIGFILFTVTEGIPRNGVTIDD